MRLEDRDDVRRLALFSGMEEASFEELLQAAFLQRFPAQVQLIEEGDRADFLYVVVEGCVELYAGGNGRETTMELIHPVSTFILAAVMKDAVYLMSARTTLKSLILMIPSANIRDLFERDAAFARAMVVELASSYRQVVKGLKNQKLRSAVERLANYLLAAEREQGGDGAITLGIDKRTVAALLGMTPENLSRAFNTLKAYGVEVDGRDIRLTAIPELERLAKPTPLIDDPGT